MPNRDIRLGIRLTADNKGFVGKVRVAKERVDQFTGATNKAGSANQRFGTTIGGLHKRVATYAAGYLGLTAALGATRRIVRSADSFTDLNNRLRLVTDSEQQLIETRKELLAISLRTRTNLTSNAQLYGRIELAARSLNRAEGDTILATELLNKQVAIGGNNSVEAAAGLTQFAQGLSSGRLQGDELRSVLENLQGVSEGLLVGFANLRQRGQIEFDVTRGNIRELAAEGVLSADLLLDAILASADDTNAKFKQVDATVSGGLTNISSAAINLIGELDEALGSSQGLSSGLLSIADAMAEVDAEEFAEALSYVDDVAIALATVMGGRLVGSIGASTVAMAKANKVSAVTAARFQAIHGRSLLAARGIAGLTTASRGLLAVFGGVPGLLATAGLALYVYSRNGEGATAATKRLREEIELLASTQNRAAASQTLNDINNKIREATDKLNDYEAQAAEVVGRSFERVDGKIVAIEETREQQFSGRIAKAKADIAEYQKLAEELKATLNQSTNTDEGSNNNSSNTAIDDALKKRLDSLVASLDSEIEAINRKYQKDIDFAEKHALELEQIGQDSAQIIIDLGKKRDDEVAALQKRHNDKVIADKKRAESEKKQLDDKAKQDRLETLRNSFEADQREVEYQQSLRLAQALGFEEAFAAAVAQRKKELAEGLGLPEDDVAVDARGILAQQQADQLAQAAGFQNTEIEQALAHKQRLIDIEYQYASNVSSVLNQIETIRAQSSRQQVQSTISLLGEVSGQYAAHSKTAFRIQQAASIANAVISTAQGAAKALEYGFPLGPVFAGLVTAAGVAQIATIRSQQPPQAFALGGVVDSPTFFSANNVANGVAGEAGPEAIMPLRRLPSGRLGVESVGGGSKSPVITVAPVIQVTVRGDAQNARQTGQTVGREAARQVEQAVVKVLRNQLRPGGVLNRTDKV